MSPRTCSPSSLGAARPALASEAQDGRRKRPDMARNFRELRDTASSGAALRGSTHRHVLAGNVKRPADRRQNRIVRRHPMRRNSHVVGGAGCGTSPPRKRAVRPASGDARTRSVCAASNPPGGFLIKEFQLQLRAREWLTPQGARLIWVMEKGPCFRKVPASLGTPLTARRRHLAAFVAGGQASLGPSLGRLGSFDDRRRTCSSKETFRCAFNETRLSKSASILFRMATDESSEFRFARFGMGLAYSFNSTAPAPAGGLVNEEKSA